MEILKQALNKIKSINKRQRDFFTVLIQGLIGSAGKKTFRNLARYTEKVEQTFSRQMKKPFDFKELNTELIKESKNKDEIFIAAQDSSFISKSGKKTHGLDYYWNGSAGRVEKGLEIDVIAAVKINGKKEGYTISAEQMPANPIPKPERKKGKKPKVSKIDFCVEHIKKVSLKLISLSVNYIVVDAFFAKKKYVDGVTSLGFQVISKLRKDARLLRRYIGPQKKIGRKRLYYKEKISEKDFESLPTITVDNGNIELKSCTAYSVSLGCLIKVVLVRKKVNQTKYMSALLFSTDIDMSPDKIYEFYVSRFQIEFIFRDAKSFTGLSDCQSLDKDRMNYHFNASLTALNVIKIQDFKVQQIQKVQRPFSMANWVRKYHVEIVINRFISMFGFDQTFIKSHPNYESILEFGNITH